MTIAHRLGNALLNHRATQWLAVLAIVLTVSIWDGEEAR